MTSLPPRSPRTARAGRHRWTAVAVLAAVAVGPAAVPAASAVAPVRPAATSPATPSIWSLAFVADGSRASLKEGRIPYQVVLYEPSPTPLRVRLWVLGPSGPDLQTWVDIPAGTQVVEGSTAFPGGIAASGGDVTLRWSFEEDMTCDGSCYGKYRTAFVTVGGSGGVTSPLVTVELPAQVRVGGGNPVPAVFRVSRPFAEDTTVHWQSTLAEGEVTMPAGATSVEATLVLGGRPGRAHRDAVWATTTVYNYAREEYEQIDDYTTSAAAVVSLVDAGKPVLTVKDAPTIVEGDSAQTSLLYPVTLSEPLDAPLTLTYRAVHGKSGYAAAVGAASPEYDTRTRTVVIPAGAQSATLSVPVFGDVTPETNLDVPVRVVEPLAGIKVSQAVGYGRVRDDDTAAATGPDLSASISLPKLVAGTGSAQVRVANRGPSATGAVAVRVVLAKTEGLSAATITPPGGSAACLAIEDPSTSPYWMWQCTLPSIAAGGTAKISVRAAASPGTWFELAAVARYEPFADPSHDDNRATRYAHLGE